MRNTEKVKKIIFDSMEKAKKNWMIDELEIHNFKSIKKLKIKPGRVNVFIGKPNAGKSNLLEALAFLGITFQAGRNIPADQIRYTDIISLFYDQSYNENIIISDGKDVYTLMSDNAEYNYTRQNVKHSDIQRIATIDKQGNVMATFNNIVASNIFKYHFRSIPQNEGQSRIENLSPDGGNLWKIVRHNSALKEFSNNFFKEFSLKVLFDSRSNKFEIIRINEDSYYLIDFSMTPDTFQRMLYYLAAIESNKHSVILFEEPESQSYPPYIQMLAERIVDDHHNQYFITTHSPFIVEKMLERAGNDEDGEIKFFVTYFEDYQTKVHELTKEEIGEVIENGIDLFFNIDTFRK